MKTTIIERHAEIQRIVDLWHKSKRQIKQPDFCKKEGISQDSLKYWITKFNKEKVLKQSDRFATGFIPVKVENPKEQTYQEIEFPNGVIFRYGQGISIETIKELIKLY
jgi:hypothetical protein